MSLRAMPRRVDGPGDIEETAKLASYARDGRSEGVAVCVLYYSTMRSEHAAATATFEAIAAATPECEFLLASIEEEPEAFERVEVSRGEPFEALVEVLFGGKRVSVGSPGEMAAALASLDFAPGSVKPAKSSPADDLWDLSAPSRAKQPRRTPPPVSRTTRRYIPSPSNDLPPFFTERRQDEEPRRDEAQQRKRPSNGGGMDDVKKAFDKFGKDLERSTKSFGRKVEEAADNAAREAEKLGSQVTGGETRREKLDRLFGLDSEGSGDQLPPEERLASAVDREEEAARRGRQAQRRRRISRVSRTCAEQTAASVLLPNHRSARSRRNLAAGGAARDCGPGGGAPTVALSRLSSTTTVGWTST
eukprot:CAMPEP_0197396682 /NCGR_PEP_ID=MMETSP1165-20131217/10082_1 /TAXON_ID=284809 /ORGANISM="Chrysocystis fragilis, Strain CCMP3189" /LENGTH=360 /DNA_ID=CAMNT_0042922533 /DNA_START=29 /DNA_END=1107 /DNA_ORIENTATION=-